MRHRAVAVAAQAILAVAIFGSIGAVACSAWLSRPDITSLFGQVR